MVSDRLLANPSPPPITPIATYVEGVRLDLLRLDQLDSWASGNKYFKLRYYLAEALTRGMTHVMSKGGMFSNHLAALAEACAHFRLRLTCIIRSHGDDPENPTLRQLRKLGAECSFVAPADFSAFDAADAAAIDSEALFIPEGANGPLGWKGTSAITGLLEPHRPTHVVLPAGTFGTALGILSAAPAMWHVIMVPAWKGCSADYVTDQLRAAGIAPHCRWSVWPDHHAGGFGRYDEDLRLFMRAFTVDTGILLDPVYTGKMLKATLDAAQSGFFPSGSRIIAVHTGGLQGLAGYRYRFPDDWADYPG